MPTVLIIPGGGLGDISFAMPGIKYFKQHGYRTACLINRPYLPAFETLEFVDCFIPVDVPQHEMQSLPKQQQQFVIDNMLNSIMSHKFLFDETTEMCGSMQGVTGWMAVKDKLPFRIRHRLPETTDRVVPYIDTVLSNLGIPKHDCEPIFGFKTTKHMVDANCFNVGICIGSDDKLRRLSPQFINSLIDILPNCKVHLFGVFSAEENYLLKKYHWKSMGLPINYVITQLSKMDVFITPDTGLFHVACFLRIPTITFQSRELIERFVCVRFPNLFVLKADNKSIQCKQNCNAKIDEKLFSDEKKPFFERLSHYSVNIHNERFKQRVDYGRIECRFSSNFSVECLDKINLKEIKNIVERFRNIV